MRVGEGLHRERELHLRVPRFVNARGPHHLHDAVHVHKAGVQRKPCTNGREVSCGLNE